MTNSLLKIENLSIIDTHQQCELVKSISLTLQPHRTLAIVGESGSGKSLFCKALLGLLPENLITQGKITFSQQSIENYTQKQWQQLRGKQISLIVQNAMAAFDPLVTLKAQLIETLQFHCQLSAQHINQRIVQSMQQVNLPVERLEHYPNQLSGGQLQRFMIALTLALQPTLIIADEPTTALDAITQYDIIEHFKSLSVDKKSTLIFITHDLGLVKDLADDIAVMYNGELIEFADKKTLFHSPKNEYTRFLIDSRIRLSERFMAIMRGHHVARG